MTPEERYLDLLKKCLTRSIFDESFDRIPVNKKTLWRRARSTVYKGFNQILAIKNMALVHTARATGETMIGMERLNNIEFCLENVIRNGIEGDVIETGVWRGGATIFMKAVLDVYGADDRNVWVADSFKGLPEPNPNKYPLDEGDKLWSHSLDVSADEVRTNFKRYGLYDDHIKFLEGFFSDTMPDAPIDKLALLRLDGDMYESTIVVLEQLYPQLSPGGYVIVDDYGCIPACKQATLDYRNKYNIVEPIKIIDWTGVFWQKNEVL